MAEWLDPVNKVAIDEWDVDAEINYVKAFVFKGDPQDFAAFSSEFIKHLEEK